MEHLVHDLRLALRSFCRTPGFVVVAVLILGLGIGIATAMFTVAYGITLRALPVYAPDRVVVLWGTGAGAASEVPVLMDRYDRFRHVTRTLGDVAGVAHYGATAFPLVDGNTPVYARQARVTGNFFPLLGAHPALGRLLRPEDDVAGAAPVMVISYGFWQRHFATDRHVLGRRLTTGWDHVTATIVGVVPPGIDYPQGVDYWIPIVPTKYPAVDLVARLAPNATPATARAELLRFIADDDRVAPPSATARGVRASGAAVHTLPELVVGPVRPALAALSIAAALLLAIACVNVGNLLLVRITARAHDLAIRRAIGAGTGAIARQLLCESVLLALGGGMLGLSIAELLRRALIAWAPPELPRLDVVRLDGVPIVLTLGITVVAALLFGVGPVVVAARGVSPRSLRLDPRAGTETRARRRLTQALVVSQLALAFVVLAGAGLLTRSLRQLEGLDLGYVADRLTIAQLFAPIGKYASAAQYNAVFDDVQRRMRAVPGVVAVSPVLAVPFLGTNVFDAQFEVADRPDLSGLTAPYLSWDAVGPDVFRAFAIPLIRGRGIAETDVATSPLVAVVSESVARRYWPNENPIGKRLRMVADTLWRTVVGVSGDIHYRTLREATPTVFFPYRQSFEQGILAVRTTSDFRALRPTLERVVRESDRDAMLWHAQSMDDLLAGPLSQPRLAAILLAGFAIAALTIAAIGLYGIIALTVRHQTRALCIRMALGATPAIVQTSVLSGALALVTIGMALGLGVALAGSRLLTRLLFEVSPTDPLTLVLVSLVFVGVALVAAYIPARRATYIDPAHSLRVD